MDGHDCSVVWVEMMLKAMQYMWKIMGPGDKNEQYDDSQKYSTSSVGLFVSVVVISWPVNLPHVQLSFYAVWPSLEVH